MPLRNPRFSGDPILEACFEGQHRMQQGEVGLAVMRVQAVLMNIGYSVGPGGADGIFGPETGNAVSAYKFDKRVSPNDPVVGPGTMHELDKEFFVDPPEVDPAFR